MDSDSSEEKYYASEDKKDTDDDEESFPPSFLALTLQMGHTVQGRLEDYWTKMEQLRTPFCGQTMTRARYYHVLCFLHFMDNNRNGVDRTDDTVQNNESYLKL